MRKLNQSEKEMIVIALGMRENYIQTGSISYDAAMVAKLGAKNMPSNVSIKALSIDQMQLMVDSNKLKTALLSDKLFIAE